MNGKISLEDHWESDRFSATGNHNFTKQDYYNRIEDTERRKNGGRQALRADCIGKIPRIDREPRL